MVYRVSIHGTDERQLVGDLGGVRQQLTYPGSGLAILGEFEARRYHRERRLRRGHAGKALAVSNGLGKFGACIVLELGFVIK